jgi:hypothetical protein
MKSSWMKKIWLLGYLWGVWSVSSYGGQIYSFVDANGVRNYTDQPPASVVSRQLHLDTTNRGIKIYKCVDSRGIIHLTDRPKDACYKLIYESSDFRSFSGGRARGRIHRKYREYRALIEQVAAETFLEPELLHAVVQTESAYNPKAVSPKGAVGLMQLMPATARRYGVVDRTDVSSNLYGGARYLRYLLRLFDNNKRLALAGYNAGENAVIRYGYKIPPYRETRHYVKKVMGLYRTHLSKN